MIRRWQKPCDHCKQDYYVKIIGEDGKKYIVPCPVVFCPTCGRRVKGEK